jgi:hypothetical protein
MNNTPSENSMLDFMISATFPARKSSYAGLMSYITGLLELYLRVKWRTGGQSKEEVEEVKGSISNESNSYL